MMCFDANYDVHSDKSKSIIFPFKYGKINDLAGPIKKE
jgi:hypothetical protein